jgi:hypothetical protein
MCARRRNRMTSRAVTPLPHQSTASRTDSPSCHQRLPGTPFRAPDCSVAFTKCCQHSHRQTLKPAIPAGTCFA